MRKTVSIDELDHFEQDDDGQLYWKGNRIAVETKVQIPWLVNVSVVVAGIATAIQALIALLMYVKW